MFRKNTDVQSVPILVVIFRILHCVLFCHATAIVGIAFFLEGTQPVSLTPDRIFALTVATPMLMGSLFFFLAVTTRVFFGFAIFLCALLAFVLAMMPLMMNLFFPMHIVVFCLAAVYGVSCTVLVRYFFTLPLPQKK